VSSGKSAAGARVPGPAAAGRSPALGRVHFTGWSL